MNYPVKLQYTKLIQNLNDYSLIQITIPRDKSWANWLEVVLW